MDLRQLAAVVAVADHGGFTAAAAALGISQPALTRRVASLEAELGAELVDRSGRTVTLTDAGRAALTPARRALAEVHDVGVALDAVRGVEAGRLELAGMPWLVTCHLAPLAARFHLRHPGVELRISSGQTTAELVARVAAAHCDVAAVALPVVAADVEVTALGAEGFVAVVPGDGELTEQLGGCTLLAPPVGTSTRLLVDRLYAALGVRPPHVVTVTQRDAVVPMALAGAGVAFVPEAAAAAVRAQGGRVVVPPVAMRREIGLVTRRGAASRAVRAFLASVA